MIPWLVISFITRQKRYGGRFSHSICYFGYLETIYRTQKSVGEKKVRPLYTFIATILGLLYWDQ